MTERLNSYHDVHIATKEILRTSLFDLPYGYELTCSRARGWSLWFDQEMIAEEYGDEGTWLEIDIAGHYILKRAIHD